MTTRSNAMRHTGLPTDTPAYQQKGKRLIDIEVYRDTGPLENDLWDVVWVCNQGDFELTLR